MTVHQKQPSRRSCGPTSVAILAGVPVADVLAMLPSVREGRRAGKRTHGTNVGELRRLLARHGWTMGPRRQGRPPAHLVAIVRVVHRPGVNSSWHWTAARGGIVYDPAYTGPMEAPRYFSPIDRARVSHYVITRP